MAGAAGKGKKPSRQSAVIPPEEVKVEGDEDVVDELVSDFTSEVVVSVYQDVKEEEHLNRLQGLEGPYCIFTSMGAIAQLLQYATPQSEIPSKGRFMGEPQEPQSPGIDSWARARVPLKKKSTQSSRLMTGDGVAGPLSDGGKSSQSMRSMRSHRSRANRKPTRADAGQRRPSRAQAVTVLEAEEYEFDGEGGGLGGVIPAMAQMGSSPCGIVGSDVTGPEAVYVEQMRLQNERERAEAQRRAVAAAEDAARLAHLDKIAQEMGRRKWMIDADGEVLVITPLDPDKLQEIRPSPPVAVRDSDTDKAVDRGRRRGSKRGGPGPTKGRPRSTRLGTSASGSKVMQRRRSNKGGDASYYTPDPTRQPSYLETMTLEAGVSLQENGSVKEGPATKPDPMHMSMDDFAASKLLWGGSGQSLMGGSLCAGSLDDSSLAASEEGWLSIASAPPTMSPAIAPVALGGARSRMAVAEVDPFAGGVRLEGKRTFSKPEDARSDEESMESLALPTSPLPEEAKGPWSPGRLPQKPNTREKRKVLDHMGPREMKAKASPGTRRHLPQPPYGETMGHGITRSPAIQNLPSIHVPMAVAGRGTEDMSKSRILKRKSDATLKALFRIPLQT
jgi:hypothetical protein